MKFFYIGLIISLAFVGEANSHEYADCGDTTNNSCWSIQNQSKETVSIQCSHQGLGSSFQHSQLSPKKVWSYQFCSGLADGLGFTAGQVSCRVKIGTKEIPVQFAATGYGDVISFTVSDKKVEVSVTDYWSKKIKSWQFE